MTLPETYKEETGEDAVNSQGEPDIDYVAWLEKRVAHLDEAIEASNVVGLLRDCVSDTWGSTSFFDAQDQFHEFLKRRGLFNYKLNK